MEFLTSPPARRNIQLRSRKYGRSTHTHTRTHSHTHINKLGSLTSHTLKKYSTPFSILGTNEPRRRRHTRVSCTHKDSTRALLLADAPVALLYARVHVYYVTYKKRHTYVLHVKYACLLYTIHTLDNNNVVVVVLFSIHSLTQCATPWRSRVSPSVRACLREFAVRVCSDVHGVEVRVLLASVARLFLDVHTRADNIHTQHLALHTLPQTSNHPPPPPPSSCAAQTIRTHAPYEVHSTHVRKQYCICAYS